MNIKAQFASVIPVAASPVEKEPEEATPVEVAPIKEQLPVFDEQKEVPVVEESAEPAEPAEEKPVEEKPVEEKPVEEKPVEEKPIEEEVKEEVKEVEKPATPKEAEKQGERRPRYRGRKEETVGVVRESEMQGRRPHYPRREKNNYRRNGVR